MSRSTLSPHERPTPRAPDTLANLGARLPVKRDDGEPRRPAVPRPAPYRSTVPTLIFHGLPPPAAKQTMLPPPPTPRMPLTDLIAQELDAAPTRPRVHDIVSADILADEENEEHERSTPLLVRSSSARSARPPALAARMSLAWRAPIAVAIALHAAAALVAIESVARVRNALEPSVAAMATSKVSERASAMAAGAAREAQRPRGCVAGESRVLSKRAMVSAGVQTISASDRVGVAVLASPREANAFEIDPRALRVLGAARLTSPLPMRRATPVMRPDEIVDAAPDPSVDPARRAFVESTGEYALAARQRGAIWIGLARDEKAEPDRGSLVRVSTAGRRAGAPAIASLGDAAMVAWAELDAASSTWTLRWLVWRPGTPPPPAHDFALPPGGLGGHAMSPSLASLGAGRAALAWTEGPIARHQVRAVMLDREGAPIGGATTLSPSDTNAGQGQIAIARGGRGIVAYFAQRAGSFELEATALDCE